MAKARQSSSSKEAEEVDTEDEVEEGDEEESAKKTTSKHDSLSEKGKVGQGKPVTDRPQCKLTRSAFFFDFRLRSPLETGG